MIVVSIDATTVVNGRACLGNRQPDVGGKGGIESAEIHKSPPILLTCQPYGMGRKRFEVSSGMPTLTSLSYCLAGLSRVDHSRDQRTHSKLTAQGVPQYRDRGSLGRVLLP